MRSRNTKKRGSVRGLQTYSCNDCERRWRNERRSKEPDQLWYRYVFGKQTIRELKEQTRHDRKTIFKYLDGIVLPEKKHEPRPIHLVVDATYFGTRIDRTSWGVILFRDSDQKEIGGGNRSAMRRLWIPEKEKNSLKDLETQSFLLHQTELLGLPRGFEHIPFQMASRHEADRG